MTVADSIMVTANKECRGCRTTKPLEAFARNRRMHDGLQQRCRECVAVYDAEYRAVNRDRLSKQAAARYAANREQRSEYQVAYYAAGRATANRFNLPPETVRAILARGCLMADTTCNGPVAIDHDHGCCPDPGRSCGRCVRGALCGNHNFLVGKYEAGRLRNHDLISACETYLKGDAA